MMNCKYCSKSDCIKRGQRQAVQRYFCKSCNKSFQSNYFYRAYDLGVNELITNLLRESCGIRSISRIIGISPKTVLSRMLKISDKVRTPHFTTLGCKFEVDEIWSYVGSKNNPTWITYAIERNTKTVIDFFVGSKSKENLRPLINRVLLLCPKDICTDGLNIYQSLIPKGIHKRFRYCTNIIERNNLTLRTHIKRLARKTICFSKKLKYLIAHLRIYFWATLQVE